MEGVGVIHRRRRCSIIASLLFVTLVVLAAAAFGGGDAAAVQEEEQRRHPLADEPDLLVTFKNKDSGEEIRLVVDKWPETLSASGFANRSGNWFYTIRERDGNGKRRRTSGDGGSRTAEGIWNALGALASITASGDSDDGAGAGERYVLIGMETSGGHKIRFVAVADQRYASITGFAQGFSDVHVRWSFRDGERHRLLPTFDDDGSSHGSSSHAVVVASNLLAALGKEASSS